MRAALQRNVRENALRRPQMSLPTYILQRDAGISSNNVAGKATSATKTSSAFQRGMKGIADGVGIGAKRFGPTVISAALVDQAAKQLSEEQVAPVAPVAQALFKDIARWHDATHKTKMDSGARRDLIEYFMQFVRAYVVFSGASMIRGMPTKSPANIGFAAYKTLMDQAYEECEKLIEGKSDEGPHHEKRFALCAAISFFVLANVLRSLAVKNAPLPRVQEATSYFITYVTGFYASCLGSTLGEWSNNKEKLGQVLADLNRKVAPVQSIPMPARVQPRERIFEPLRPAIGRDAGANPLLRQKPSVHADPVGKWSVSTFPSDRLKEGGGRRQGGTRSCSLSRHRRSCSRRRWRRRRHRRGDRSRLCTPATSPRRSLTRRRSPLSRATKKSCSM